MTYVLEKKKLKTLKSNNFNLFIYFFNPILLTVLYHEMQNVRI